MADESKARVRFAPTAEHRARVAAMAAEGLPQEEICHAVINPATGEPIARQTLRMRFTRELASGRAEVAKRKSKQTSNLLYRTSRALQRAEQAKPARQSDDGWPPLAPNERVAGQSEHGRVVIYIPDNGSDEFPK